MSSANVLPSAPPELPPQPDFRMQKVNEISAALNKEVGHYRAIAKKYKRAKKAVNWGAAGSSGLSAAFSSESLAPLFLLWACRLQYRLVASVGLSLSPLQGSLSPARSLTPRLRNIRRLSPSPLRNATLLTGFFLKPWPTISCLTANFS